jgi:hypothetical protein
MSHWLKENRETILLKPEQLISIGGNNTHLIADDFYQKLPHILPPQPLK